MGWVPWGFPGVTCSAALSLTDCKDPRLHTTAEKTEGGFRASAFCLVIPKRGASSGRESMPS